MKLGDGRFPENEEVGIWLEDDFAGIVDNALGESRGMTMRPEAAEVSGGGVQEESVSPDAGFSMRLLAAENKITFPVEPLDHVLRSAVVVMDVVPEDIVVNRGKVAPLSHQEFLGAVSRAGSGANQELEVLNVRWG